MTFDALLLNAGVRQSLMAVRSLGRQGLRVAAALGAGPGTRVPAFSSRWCGEPVWFDAPDASDAYLALLEAWLARAGARVVIPSHDGTIAMLRAHRARLERTTRLALASEAALTVAVNKERTLAAATRVGLKVPREAVIKTLADLPAALAHIGLPGVIKPAESWVPGTEGAGGGHWVGPQLVVTEDEARRAADAVTKFGVPVLFQQYLTGRREALSFLYARGRMHARFAQWAARTRPPLGGESVLRQSIPIPEDLGPGAEALVREIDLEGYCEVEFRRDAAGEPFLMEINPRLSASVEVAVRAGVDFPHLLFRWASGDPIPVVTDYRVGGWMRNLGADIDTSLLALDQRGRPGIPAPARVVADFGLSFLRPSGYDYFWWSDPGPAVAATSAFLGEMMGRVTSRVRRIFR